MKRLSGVRETNVPLNAVSLDLRSPAGKTSEGYFRLIVNALSERDGRLRRLGGWRALSLNNPTDQKLTFAIVGDQGWGNQAEADVAAMIKTWSPAFIATVGDNIYQLSTSMTLAQADQRFAETNTLQYGDFISAQKFFPSIGNHDTDYDPGTGTNPAAPVWYRSKFPYAFQNNTKNYYRVHFNEGPVELFVLSSGLRTDGTHFEPDGHTVGSVQYQWLRQALESSTAMFKIVVFHHPPYSSGSKYHPGLTHMRWDFGAMGADAVFSGHEHNYERWLNKEIPYVITGHGGAPLNGFHNPNPAHTKVDDPPRHGAMRLTTEGYRLKVEAVMLDGTIFDTFYITKRNNEDLHDQLLTNAVNPMVRVDLPPYPVISWGFDGSSPGTVTATTATVAVTGPDAEAGIINGSLVEMPTVSVVSPTTRTFAAYTNYSWRVTVRVLSNWINPPDQGWVELSFTSTIAGGTVPVKFYTVPGANLPPNANVYAYGCAPIDAVQWQDTGSADKIMLWDFNAQDNIFVPPTNTMVICQ
jgi:tartrate-resistant acid phosphatase type 5